MKSSRIIFQTVFNTHDIMAGFQTMETLKVASQFCKTAGGRVVQALIRLGHRTNIVFPRSVIINIAKFPVYSDTLTVRVD
jgi:hypothetical protein